MKPLLKIILLLIVFSSCHSPKQAINQKTSLFAKDNLIAWCIVPFDSENRNPVERAQMLHNLGFTKYVWDWRAEHLPLLEEEIAALKTQKIELTGVWFWVNGNSKNLLDDANETILKTLEETNTKTCLWVSFPASYFKDLSETERITKGVKILQHIYRKAQKMGQNI